MKSSNVQPPKTIFLAKEIHLPRIVVVFPLPSNQGSSNKVRWEGYSPGPVQLIHSRDWYYTLRIAKMVRSFSPGSEHLVNL